MRMKRNKTGSRTYSESRQKSERHRQTEHISKYFHHKSTNSIDSNALSEELNKTQSPYGQFTSKMSPVLNNSMDENSEFKTPKPVKRPVKKLDLRQPPTGKSKNKKKSAISKGKNQKLLSKMISSSTMGGVNREHLETALALSISEVSGSRRREEREEIDTHVISHEEQSEVHIISTQEKVANVRKTLEEFGFTNRSAGATRSLREVKKKSKKSRYRYITPILFSRTEEDRNKLITAKISQVLRDSLLCNDVVRNVEKIHLRSEYLRSLECDNACIFVKHCTESKNLHEFYAEALNLSPSITECGVLLKKWEDIPGRDVSPSPTPLSNQTLYLSSQLPHKNSFHSKTSIQEVHLLPSPTKCGSLLKKLEEIQEEVSLSSTLRLSLELPHKNSFHSKSPIQPTTPLKKCKGMQGRAVSPLSSDILNQNHDLLETPCEIHSSLNTLVEKTKRNTCDDVIEARSSESYRNTCVSPDLFDSEDDCNFLGKSIDEDLRKSLHFVEEITPARSSQEEVSCEGFSRTSPKQLTPMKRRTRNDDRGFENKDAEFSKIKFTSGNLIQDINDDIETPEETEGVIEKCTDNKMNGKFDGDVSKSVLVVSTTVKDNHCFEMVPKKYNIFSASLLSNFADGDIYTTNMKLFNGEVSDSAHKYGVSVQKGNDKLSFDLTQSSDEESSNDDDKAPVEINEDEISTEFETVANSVARNEQKGTENIISSNILTENSKLTLEEETENQYNAIEDELVGACLKSTVDARKFDEEMPSYFTVDLTQSSTESDSPTLKRNVDYTTQLSSFVHGDRPEIDSKVCSPGKVNVNRHLEMVSDSEESSKSCSVGDGNVSITSRSRNAAGNSFSLNSSYVENSLPKITFTRNDSQSSGCSQEAIYISDEELHYSSIHSTPHVKKHMKKHVSYQLSDSEHEIDLEQQQQSIERNENLTSNTDIMKFVEEILKSSQMLTSKLRDDVKITNFPKGVVDKVDCTGDNLNFDAYATTYNKNTGCKTNVKENETISPRSTQLDLKNSEILTASEKAPMTPKSTQNCTDIARNHTGTCSSTGNVLIKKCNVTPMPDYDSMDTPNIQRELHKIGVKNLKRRRGAQLLKHIYDAIHPIVEDESSDSERNVKRRKQHVGRNSRKNLQVQFASSADVHENVRGHHSNENRCAGIEIVGDLVSESDIVFERKHSTKVASCRVPLDIAWHNFVSSNPDVHEHILLYEPLQLETVHARLKESGHKYHVQDLLMFLDKKCITVRTQSQGGHGKKRY